MEDYFSDKYGFMDNTYSFLFIIGRLKCKKSSLQSPSFRVQAAFR